ncbi:MarR family winged helix-turn-helix transcriptional regulator [Actinoplanes sp. G11-F43]|uniref:MarR family winged helix-turn-helix transcriptional regulator n=1 Tax=Actinoplanes sp. G11-F43 TaxID=3424130 RepID=UPI003D346FE6
MAGDTTDEIVASWDREVPGVAGDAFALGKRASRLAALLSAPVEATLTRFGLTKAEFDVLAVLRAAGSPYRLRPSTLSQRLLLTSGGTSNVLRRLAAAGLVERDPDRSDARSSWVRLTDRGAETAEQAVRAATAAQAAALRDVPAATVHAASEALRAALIALDDIP